MISKDGNNIPQVLKELTTLLKRTETKDIDAESVYSNIIKYSTENGLKIDNIHTKLDKLTIASGFLALYNNELPLRCFGTGSKKILSFSLQKIYKEVYNILLFDEIEAGLEPNRIRGMLNNLHEDGKQVFLTTHSPVVLRELKVENKELYKCTIDRNGKMEILRIEGNYNQRQIRTNAESFLSNKIILCEGKTEIGIVRALEEIKINEGGTPLWSLATMYYEAGGDGKLKEIAINLLKLKYSIAVLCDYDNINLVDELKKILNLEIFTWDKGKCTEEQLINDLEFSDVLDLLITINNVRLSEEDSEIKYLDHTNKLLSKECEDLDALDDCVDTRNIISQILKGIKKKEKPDKYEIPPSIKNISYSEKVFKKYIPKLNSSSTMKIQLNKLWEWTQKQ